MPPEEAPQLARKRTNMSETRLRSLHTDTFSFRRIVFTLHAIAQVPITCAKVTIGTPPPNVGACLLRGSPLALHKGTTMTALHPNSTHLTQRHGGIAPALHQPPSSTPAHPVYLVANWVGQPVVCRMARSTTDRTQRHGGNAPALR